MTAYAYAPPPPPSLAIAGSDARCPVARIFCVGRNYAAHAAEMSMPAEPVFFMKPASALVPGGGPAPYPADTERLDHEVELALIVGAAGAPRTEDEARALVFGYAAALDLTRRDAQARAKAGGEPWDAAKGFDASAPVSQVRPAAEIGHPRAGRIWFEVDGEMRQDADLSEMILSPEAMLVALARQWRLAPGDLVLTGTPAGVGPMARGARGRGGIDGVGEIAVEIT